MSKIPELPRYLHKPGEESLLVVTEGDYLGAIADGWSVSNQFPETVAPAPDVEEPAPPKRGRKKAE